MVISNDLVDAAKPDTDILPNDSHGEPKRIKVEDEACSTQTPVGNSMNIFLTDSPESNLLHGNDVDKNNNQRIINTCSDINSAFNPSGNFNHEMQHSFSTWLYTHETGTEFPARHDWGNSQGTKRTSHQHFVIRKRTEKVRRCADSPVKSVSKARGTSLNVKKSALVEDLGHVTFSLIPLCIECKQPMSSKGHYQKYTQCSKCRYATACQYSSNSHKKECLKNECEVTNSKNRLFPKEKKMDKALMCMCGYSTWYGMKMAEHLVQCDRDTCSYLSWSKLFSKYAGVFRQHGRYDALEQDSIQDFSREYLERMGIACEEDKPAILPHGETVASDMPSVMHDRHLYSYTSQATELDSLYVKQEDGSMVVVIKPENET